MANGLGAAFKSSDVPGDVFRRAKQDVGDAAMPLYIGPEDGVPCDEIWVSRCKSSLIERNMAVVWTPEERILAALVRRLRAADELKDYDFLVPRAGDFATTDLDNLHDGPLLLALPSTATLLRFYHRQRNWIEGDPVVSALKAKSITLLVWGQSPSLPGIDRAAVLHLDDLAAWLPAMLEPFHGEIGYELEQVKKRIEEQRHLWPSDPITFYQSVREIVNGGNLPAYLDSLDTPEGKKEAEARLASVRTDEAISILRDPAQAEEHLLGFICAFFPDLPASMVDELVSVLHMSDGKPGTPVARARLEPGQCPLIVRQRIREEFVSAPMRRLFFRFVRRIQHSPVIRSSHIQVREMSVQLVLDAAALEPAGFGADVFWRTSLAEVYGPTSGTLSLQPSDWERLAAPLLGEARQNVIERAAAIWSGLVISDLSAASRVFRSLIDMQRSEDVLDIILHLRNWADSAETIIGESLRRILSEADAAMKSEAAALIERRARTNASSTRRYLALLRSAPSREAVECGVRIFRTLLRRRRRSAEFEVDGRWSSLGDGPIDFSDELFAWFGLAEWRNRRLNGVIPDGIWFCTEWVASALTGSAKRYGTAESIQTAQAMFDRWVSCLDSDPDLVASEGVPVLESMLLVEWARARPVEGLELVRRRCVTMNYLEGAALAHCLKSMSLALLEGASICIDLDRTDTSRVAFISGLRKMIDDIREIVVSHITERESFHSS